MSAEIRYGSEVSMEELPPILRERYAEAKAAAEGTAISLRIKMTRWIGPSWSLVHGNATDVLSMVGGTITGIDHRLPGSDKVFRTTVSLNGDEVANRAVLAAFGFSPEDQAVPSRPDYPLVSYVRKTLGPTQPVVGFKPL